MGLVDESGNPVDESTLRLPSPEDTILVHRQADGIQQAIEAAVGQSVGPLVDLQAQVEALVSLTVPPDGDNPVRRMFEHRRQARRLLLLQEIAQDVRDANAPKLYLAGADIGAAIRKAQGSSGG